MGRTAEKSGLVYRQSTTGAEAQDELDSKSRRGSVSLLGIPANEYGRSLPRPWLT